MCGSSKTKNIQGSWEIIPEWITSGGQEIFDTAREQFDGQFKPYTDQRVAQPGETYDAAKQQFTNYSQQPTLFSNAAQGMQQVAGVTAPTKSISEYMSPYTEAVLSPVLRRIRESGAAARNATAAEATMAGAYGDSRHGVADAINQRTQRDAETDATSSAYQSAFDRATAERGADISRFMASLSGMTGVQQAQDNQQNNILSRMLGLSEYDRSIDQAGLDAKFSEFMRGQTEPLQQSSILMQLLNAAPYAKQQVGMSQGSQPNTGGYSIAGSLLGSTGVGNAVGSGLSSLGSSAAGAIGTGLSAISALFSDRRLKTDIETVGELENGLKVYKYRYKDGGPSMIGLMAQEVAEIKPEAVAIMPGGWLGVDYAEATRH